MKKNELEKEAEDTGENKDDQWEGICIEAGSWNPEDKSRGLDHKQGREAITLSPRERREARSGCHWVCRLGWGREGV